MVFQFFNKIIIGFPYDVIAIRINFINRIIDKGSILISGRISLPVFVVLRGQYLGCQTVIFSSTVIKTKIYGVILQFILMELIIFDYIE